MCVYSVVIRHGYLNINILVVVYLSKHFSRKYVSLYDCDQRGLKFYGLKHVILTPQSTVHLALDSGYTIIIIII